jgi:hypothetical protein
MPQPLRPVTGIALLLSLVYKPGAFLDMIRGGGNDDSGSRNVNYRFSTARISIF